MALGCSTPASKSPLADLGKADVLVPACSFDTAFIGGETSQELAASVVAGREVNAEVVDSLSGLEARQLVATFAQLDMFSPGDDVGADVAEVFELADEGNVDILELEIEVDGEVQAFDWIKFHAGDTEVGVIFADNSQTVVADISDGDVRGCAIPESDLNGVVCAQEEGDPSSVELTEMIVSGRELSLDDSDASEEELRQLIAVAAHAGVEATTVAEVLAIADEGTMEVLKLGMEVEEGETAIIATWVRYFSADVEVGVIFGFETSEIHGDVVAGQVRSCVSLQAVVDDEVSSILFDKDLEGLNVTVSLSNLRAQEGLGNNVVGFTEALDKALDGLLSDSEHPESPLSLVTEEIGAEGVAGVECLETLDPNEALVCILNQSGELQLAEFGETPEDGGSVEQDWIFVLRTDFSDHIHWAVVSRADPDAPVRVSGFN